MSGNQSEAKRLVENGENVDVKSNTDRTPLSLAAEKGYEAVVQLLLSKDGVDPNSKDKDGRTPLSWAAESGQEAVVKLMLAKDGVDPDSKDNDGRTPLSWAAKRGQEAVVQLLLVKDGVDPNSKDNEGRTPLSWAAEFEEEAVVKLMLAKDGVDPNSKDKDGRTPLSWAAESEKEAVVKLMLAKDGVDPDSKDNDGRTPLSWAAKRGQEAVVQLLLAKDGADVNSMGNDSRMSRTGFSGFPRFSNSTNLILRPTQSSVDINSINNDSQTPLSTSTGRPPIPPVYNIYIPDIPDTPDIIVPDINFPDYSYDFNLIPRREPAHLSVDTRYMDSINSNSNDKDGRTPLSLAAKRGQEAVVELMLAKDGVDPNSKDKDGRTPLSWAAESEKEAVVKLMLAKDGVDPNSKDNDGRTPLSWAAESGQEAVVKLMLAKDGVDPNSKDNDGRTPLSWAAGRWDGEAVVELFLAKDDVDPDSKDNDGRTPLSWAAGRWDGEAVVELFLAKDDVDPDSKDNDGRTPLSWAAGRWDGEAVVELFLAKDDVDPDSKDNDGRTPLSWAAGRWHGEAVVELFLAKDDVDPDSKDNNGRTPLTWAAKRGQEAVVQLLLSKDGVDPDSKDNNGWTPLTWAAKRGQEAVVQLLLSKDGVDPDSKDNNGWTPLTWAAKRGQEAVVQLLLSKDGVDPDSKDNNGRTPLSWAAEKRYVEVVELLEWNSIDFKDSGGTGGVKRNAAGQVDIDSESRRTTVATPTAQAEMSILNSIKRRRISETEEEPHILRDQAGALSIYNWKELLPLLPESLRWGLEYSKPSDSSGCWTFTPMENLPSVQVPLTIARAPVVVPVEYRYPLIAPVAPPPDPHPVPICPFKALQGHTIEMIFSTFTDTMGFYLLINGFLQILVPSDFDFTDALSHKPNTFGGLKVSYIPLSVAPTAQLGDAGSSFLTRLRGRMGLASSPQETSLTSTSGPALGAAEDRFQLKIGMDLQVRVKGSRSLKKYQGKLGVMTKWNSKSYVTISTHVITKALAAAKAEFPPGDIWSSQVDVYSSNVERKIGGIAKTFDPNAEHNFPSGFHHDISLVEVSDEALLPLASNLGAREQIEWISPEGWRNIKLNTQDLSLLKDTNRNVKSIGILESQYQMVGQGIFRNQHKPGYVSTFKQKLGITEDNGRKQIGEWETFVSRSVLYRVHPNFEVPGAHSGSALCVGEELQDGTRIWKVAAFQSFLQEVSGPDGGQRYDLNGDLLYSMLKTGSVAFYGALEVPAELKEHVIV
ncbi:hypothetical protein FOMA001_g17848 [Fusarium oxysporum f. sp. matthiolae]|nr:hypothetical protein FOMA001_g17848 [Fusarium oxysporum f. sp. matthiolae]